MVFNRNSKAGSKKLNKPRQLNNNTDLCVDIKTFLRHDSIAEFGKHYQGVLTHDSVEHYTFTEASNADKRNPQVFCGNYITVTRRDDGTLRLNFRPKTMGQDFDAGIYASAVANEILWALTSLLGK